MENIIEEKIEIEIQNANFKLKGSIYRDPATNGRQSWIINLPGFLEHRESKFVKYFSERFARAGYYVLSYDYRAHGETSKETGKNWLKYFPQIVSDIHLVINWIIENRSDYLKNGDIFLFGRSFGGVIILSHGYKDERAKKLISLCTRYDYHSYKKVPFPEKIIKAISPIYFLEKNDLNKKRIYLAHCKDDQQIPFENLNLIKEHLGLPSQNVLIFDNGGHSFKNHREEVFSKSLEFLKS
ncbi:MAG: alpha/beta hydrolase [Candidatus Lokiarchaeota archaeon]